MMKHCTIHYRSIGYITESYRHIYDHVLIIEHPLIRGEYESIVVDLEKMRTTFTWSIDFIRRVRRTIHDFEERLFKSKSNIEKMKRILSTFMKTPLYVRSDTRQDPLLIVVDKENRVMKRNDELRQAGIQLHQLLKVMRRRLSLADVERCEFSKTNGC